MRENDDKVIMSIAQVDMDGLRFPVIAVHEDPNDYPGKCAARIFDMDKPTRIVIVKETLGELQKDIRSHTNMLFFPRDDEDVESLVGAWI